MIGLSVYLAFDGDCAQAMEFYKSIFGGNLELMTFENSPMPVDEEYKKRILHAVLKSDLVFFMASDILPGQPFIKGTNYSMSLNFTEPDEQAAVWEKLSENAVIPMPLQDTFWNARFGMLIDKFGINWMLNYDRPQQ
jgi:PhnB protein